MSASLACLFLGFALHGCPHAHVHHRHHVPGHHHRGLADAGAAARGRRAKVAPEAATSVQPHFRGESSFYGEGFDGRRTACGTRFNRWGLTAAHRTLPCGTIIQVVNLENGRMVNLTVDDAGPFVAGRILDVSEGAAVILGFRQKGTALVDVQPLNWGPQ